MRAFRTAGAIILTFAYGYSVKEHDDPLVKVVEAAGVQFSECLEPGAHLADLVPLRMLHFLRRRIDMNANYSFLSPSPDPHSTGMYGTRGTDSATCA